MVVSARVLFALDDSLFFSRIPPSTVAMSPVRKSLLRPLEFSICSMLRPLRPAEILLLTPLTYR